MTHEDASAFGTEAEADQEARRRNDALVAGGGGYSDYWVPTQGPDGVWTVEYRRGKVRWHQRLIDGLLGS